MQLTLEEAVGYHKKLWNGIADRIAEKGIWNCDQLKIKREAMKELFPLLAKGEVKNDCFLCDFAHQESVRAGTIRDGMRCEKCPLVPKRPVMCLDGLYTRFNVACSGGNKDMAVSCARQIAGLPVQNPLYL